uniref:Uncharacterized protein n=1 Tax=Rhizophora mucronata TaxID=61149 RepID=A0A2P2P4G7_RHIMU
MTQYQTPTFLQSSGSKEH